MPHVYITWLNKAVRTEAVKRKVAAAVSAAMGSVTAADVDPTKVSVKFQWKDEDQHVDGYGYRYDDYTPRSGAVSKVAKVAAAAKKAAPAKTAAVQKVELDSISARKAKGALAASRAAADKQAPTRKEVRASDAKAAKKAPAPGKKPVATLKKAAAKPKKAATKTKKN
ncbi:hypothetical protein, variant [Capsaspora owczarzaki ATCC 30864]|uniref:Uncharacterized protein n=1 Tax=Capsaspora owczarzaki (strain ATCC 30864) TaxID=595528 RepID=A0A0D2X5N5_CAPO3|nr:hypothetical protein, variant [Capsaspora owczarzaki ATCC 30864]